jgi:hypothetical protein
MLLDCYGNIRIRGSTRQIRAEDGRRSVERARCARPSIGVTVAIVSVNAVAGSKRRQMEGRHGRLSHRDPRRATMVTKPGPAGWLDSCGRFGADRQRFDAFSCEERRPRGG